MFNFEKIILNGLNLIPSNEYTAHIEGLFDSSNSNSTSNLFTNGEYLGGFKTSSKKITLTLIRKRDTFNSFSQINYLINQLK